MISGCRRHRPRDDVPVGRVSGRGRAAGFQIRRHAIFCQSNHQCPFSILRTALFHKVSPSPVFVWQSSLARFFCVQEVVKANIEGICVRTATSLSFAQVLNSAVKVSLFVKMSTEATAKAFFSNPHFAVVGASSNPAKFGHKSTFKLLRSRGMSLHGAYGQPNLGISPGPQCTNAAHSLRLVQGP